MLWLRLKSRNRGVSLDWNPMQLWNFYERYADKAATEKSVSLLQNKIAEKIRPPPPGGPPALYVYQKVQLLEGK